MLGSEFLKETKKNSDSQLEFLTDSVDKWNYNITSTLSIIVSLILLSINYLNFEFQCLSTKNDDDDAYINDYCLAKGTLVMLPNETLPETRIGWSKYKDEFHIFYIQILSIMISLQGLLYIFAYLIWILVCRGKAAYELVNVADAVHNNDPISKEETESVLNDICEKFQLKSYIHRELRRGYSTKLRRFLAKHFNVFSFSKRHGTYLVSWYIFTKMLYVTNSLIQLIAFQKSFTYTKDNWMMFPYVIIDILFNGKTWQETRMFPKSTICVVDDRKNVIQTHTDVFNCIIPSNVWNEKLIPIIWIYIGFTLMLNIWSLFSWIGFLMINRLRQSFVKDFIKEDVSKSSLSEFVNEYLKCDGVFLLKMVEGHRDQEFISNLVNRVYLESLK